MMKNIRHLQRSSYVILNLNHKRLFVDDFLNVTVILLFHLQTVFISHEKIRLDNVHTNENQTKILLNLIVNRKNLMIIVHHYLKTKNSNNQIQNLNLNVIQQQPMPLIYLHIVCRLQ